jgi:site-specific recombinase XerD
MAQVFRRSWKNKNGRNTQSKIYYCRFQINGRDYVRSTEKTTERAALAKMKALMQGISAGAQVGYALETLIQAIAEIPEEHREEARREASAKLLSESARKLALEEVWQTWLDHPGKRTPSSSTLAAYVGQWKRFKKWVGSRGTIYLHDVDETQAHAYATNLNKSGISPRTYNAHIKLLRSMFKTLATTAGLTENVWQSIALKESASEGRRNLTPAELKKVCSCAQGSMRYLFALIPLHPVLTAMLQELRKKSKGKHLFPNECPEYKKDTTAISKQVQDFLKNTCKIETQEVIEGRKYAVCRVGFHSLRHSFVSLCALNRVPQVAVMELVGHGSPAMTALYSHAGDAAKLEAVAALPALNFDVVDAK